MTVRISAAVFLFHRKLRSCEIKTLRFIIEKTAEVEQRGRRRKEMYKKQEIRMRREQAEEMYPGYQDHARFLRWSAAGLIALRYVLLFIQGFVMEGTGIGGNWTFLMASGIGGLLWIWLMNMRSWKFAIVMLVLTAANLLGNLAMGNFSDMLYFWRLGAYAYAVILLLDLVRFVVDLGYYIYFIASPKVHFTVRLNYETAHSASGSNLFWKN